MVVQHLIFLVGGYLFANRLDMLILGASRSSTRVTRVYTQLLRANFLLNRRGLITFAVAGILAGFWHVPSNFNAAVLDEAAHLQMHVTFIVVGGLVFMGSKLLTQRTRHFLVLLPGKAMGIFGAFLLFKSEHVYEVYPVAEQATAGLIMIVMMFAMDLTILPYCLYAYFGKKTS